MRRAILLACLFLSGAGGLIAEVCWIRRASLVFGSTVFATSSVVAIFFLGLAIGSWWFGRISERTPRPLRLYGCLEIGLAALVLASPAAFAATETLYGHFYRAASGSTWVGRILLLALVILPPTVLMGGTLPLFCRQFVQGRVRIVAGVGLLYALNTLGAAAGCAAAGFLLIPALGLRRTLLLGALLSLVAGITAVASHLPALAPVPQRDDSSPEPPRPVPMKPPRTAPNAPETPPSGPEGTARDLHRTVVPVLFFAVGFVALGYEVLWTRFLALVVRTTLHTYTLSLTVVLLGIVLGSCLVSRLPDAVTRRARLFGSLAVLGALVMLATMLLPPRAWQVLDSETWTCFALALVPAMLSGASLPLAVRLLAVDSTQVGRITGALTAVNTLGGIAGALCVGFLFLPLLGLQRSVLLTSGSALSAGFVAWWALDGRSRRASRLLAIAAGTAAWLAIPRLLPTRLPADFLAAREILVDYREGLEANLAVVRKQRALQLEADRWWQGQDRKTHQIMAAHLPMLLHPRPQRVLVVGVGAGQTPGRILHYRPERLDCVDIEPAVFDLVRRHFPSHWMDDPRVRLLREDGRNYIAHTGARYDVIALEVGQVFRPGAAAFYSTDFYRRARARLEPGGLVSQFVPLAFLSPETFRSLLASFLAVFPQSLLWYNTSELLLVGANAERLQIDPSRLDLLASDAAIHDDLRWSHWDGPKYWLHQVPVFLGGYLCGPAGLTALAANAPLLDDDRPVLAQATWKASEQQMNEVPILGLLRAHLEPLAPILAASLPDTTLAAAAAVRERNLGDMVASALLRRVETLREAGRHGEIEALLHDALRSNPESVQANRLMADLLLLGGRFDAARRFYDRALTLRPDDGASHLGLALLLQAQHRFAEAVAHYRIGLQQDPYDPEAHNNLGAALVQEGDLNGARQHFEAALRLRPGFADASQNLTRLQAFQSGGTTAPRQGADH